jgi:hypothetical protein
MRYRPLLLALALLTSCSSPSNSVLDASALDAAAQDSTAEDATPLPADAGSHDAASQDASLPEDADSLDATALDASAPDARVEDAAALDGTPIDAGGACSLPPTETTTATLHVTADDVRSIWVNGVQVEVADFGARNWHNPSNLPLLLHKNPSIPNVVAIQATNLYAIDGLDRGLIVLVQYPRTATSSAEWVSNHRTKVATASTAGWTEPLFDDHAWIEATELGPDGQAPWGPIIGASSAQWIWTYLPGSLASKPVEESIFARMTLYLLPSGQISDQPGCP